MADISNLFMTSPEDDILEYCERRKIDSMTLGESEYDTLLEEHFMSDDTSLDGKAVHTKHSLSLKWVTFILLVVFTPSKAKHQSRTRTQKFLLCSCSLSPGVRLFHKCTLHCKCTVSICAIAFAISSFDVFRHSM